MFRRIRILIRILMGGAFGCCVVHILYALWHYHRYTALYLSQSAPWYTSILLSVGMTAVFCFLMIIIDWGIGLCIRATDKEGGFPWQNLNV